MLTINQISSRWILDSRGIPTIVCNIILKDETANKLFKGKSSVPSGASTGIHEALELRDNDDTKFNGNGVNKAISNLLNVIGQKLIGQKFEKASQVDEFMLNLEVQLEKELSIHENKLVEIEKLRDQIGQITGNLNEIKKENEIDENQISYAQLSKSILGANTVLAISMSVHRAFASSENLELWKYLRNQYFLNQGENKKFPSLMCNIFNGGKHASNNIDIQEFMVIPKTGNIESDIQTITDIYQKLKQILGKQGQSTSVGDEGGFAPDYNGTAEVLKIIDTAAEECGYTKINYDLALDCAASEFYNKETNSYSVDGINYSQSALTDFYTELSEEFNLVSIEDPFAEDDLLGWELITTKIGKKRLLIGDDLFTTNSSRFSKLVLDRASNSNTNWDSFNFENAKKNNIANGILIKPNQIGSILETANMINLAKKCEYAVAVSHRSGETNDDFISDLAFACQSEYIKLGAPARGERVAKYNRLLEIWEDISVG
jgi:enolase